MKILSVLLFVLPFVVSKPHGSKCGKGSAQAVVAATAAIKKLDDVGLNDAGICKVNAILPLLQYVFSDSFSCSHDVSTVACAVTNYMKSKKENKKFKLKLPIMRKDATIGDKLGEVCRYKNCAKELFEYVKNEFDNNEHLSACVNHLRDNIDDVFDVINKEASKYIEEKKEELGTEYTDMANYALESFLEQKDDIADIKGEDVKAHIDFFFEMADKVCEDTCRSEYVPYLEGISNGFKQCSPDEKFEFSCPCPSVTTFVAANALPCCIEEIVASYKEEYKEDIDEYEKSLEEFEEYAREKFPDTYESAMCYKTNFYESAARGACYEVEE